nr:hypothetical protein [Tanacetum cinerariifolium]
FWNTVIVKQSNDITRLQALVDKKKVVVTEATIRDALHLDDAKDVDCLPNEEIFTTLARMGYEKPSTKLTFYKAFFSNQWKFLIHTILQSMSAKRTLGNEFNSMMASAVICLATEDIKEMKDVFDSTKRDLSATWKENELLNDKLLEAKLKHEIECCVLLGHECVNNNVQDKIEKIKRDSIEIQDEMQKRINILENDV